MITKEKIKAGLHEGAVRLITDPNMESGTEEYMKCVPVDDIADEIFEAVASFKDSGFEDEYEYYDEKLRNVKEGI